MDNISPQADKANALGKKNSFSYSHQNKVPKTHHATLEDEICEPLAIVGISLKFPRDAVSEELFWKMIMQKRCASTDFPTDRMNVDAFHDPKDGRLNTMSMRGAHFLEEDIRAFDAPFFAIPPLEAATLDPQQKCLLEVTYRALENAGLSLSSVKGSNTSVHVGCFITDFNTTLWRDVQSIPKYSATGSAGSILANRLSWFFDLHGPSMTVDTACSSSMAAVHLSCSSLWSKETDMGIVAGSNMIFSPELNIALSNMNFLSPDSRCYSFDSRANGYARGEGVGVLIIKRLSDALAHGDTIRAVVRSSGINQDGFTARGVTQPNGLSQIQLINETYFKRDLDMGLTRFVEAHGTGTALGDPTEARAIGECFTMHRSRNEPLYIGSVKANIGHLEGSSGIAGIIKCILALERGVIPPNTNLENLNPHIDAEFLNLEFPMDSIPWPTPGVRRASVNSFGFGGTNAHIVLDDAYHYLRSKQLDGNHCTYVPLTERQNWERGDSSIESKQSQVASSITPVLKLFTWSAADEATLQRIFDEFSHYFTCCDQGKSANILDDLAYTLNARRSLLPWRSYMVTDCISKLQLIKQSISKPIKAIEREFHLGFVFTGQGAQWYAMGRELQRSTVFKESLLESQRCLDDIGCKWRLLDELAANRNESRINEAEFSQPLTTAIQLALVDFLREIGIFPATVVGHSSGEIAAAYCIGSISKMTAMRISYYRGVLVSKLARSAGPPYRMAAVGLSEEQIYRQFAKMDHAPEFDKNLMTVSCINSPRSVTISGPESQVDALIFDLKDVFARKLAVNVGYHSPQMGRISEEYLDRIGTKNKAGDILPTKTTMFSSVTGEIISANELQTGQYWVQNMVSPVNFLAAMRNCCPVSAAEVIIKKLDKSHLRQRIMHAWLEIGPHSTLQGPIRDILASSFRGAEVGYASALVRNQSAIESLFNAAGTLFCRGAHFNLNRLNELFLSRSKQPVVLSDLPQYPFNHSILYWNESSTNKGFRFRQHAHNDLLGSQVTDWNSREPKWRLIIRLEELPWVKDHKVDGSILYPAAGMLAMAIEAVKQLSSDFTQPPMGYEIKNTTFHSPLIITSGTEEDETQLSLMPTAMSGNRKETWYDFRIYQRRTEAEWNETCRGSIRLDYGSSQQEIDSKPVEGTPNMLQKGHAAAMERCTKKINSTKFYNQLKDIGLEYGPSFRRLEDIHFNDEGEAVATVAIQHPVSSQHHIIHPTTLDSFFQLVFAALYKENFATARTMVPTRIDRLWISNTGLSKSSQTSMITQAYAKACHFSQRSARASLTILGQSDQLQKVQIDGLEVTALSGGPLKPQNQPNVQHLCYQLHWKVDLATLSPIEILKYCERVYEPETDPVEWFQDADFLCLAFASAALEELRAKSQCPVRKLEKYARTLQVQLDQDLAKLPKEKRTQRREQLEDTERLNSICVRMASSRQARLFIKVGRNLSKVLLGEVDAVQLIFEDEGLLAGFYEEMNETPQCFKIFAQYLDALSFKDPTMNILEIGAGTGSTTKLFQDTLVPTDRSPRYGQYDFTDISTSFFETAKTKFDGHNRMNYRVLDIEKEPLGQGFEESSYDLIVAANVLHATVSLSKTLKNVLKLLRPGGKLILSEVTVSDSPRYSFFGILPGWWLASEDYRQLSPCISEQKWYEVLKKNGFTGTDIVFRDYKAHECHGWSIMVSTAATAISDYPSRIPSPVIILNKTSKAQRDLYKEIDSRLILHGYPNAEAFTLEEAALLHGKGTRQCILINDVGSFLLRNLRSTEYLALRTILSSVASLLWVSDGGGRQSLSTPDYGIVQGFSRVSRQENIDVKLVLLALDPNSPTYNHERATNICKVFGISSSALGRGSYEQEYLEEEGLLQINRLVEYKRLNKHIFERTTLSPFIGEFGGGSPLKLSFKIAGFSESLQFIADDIHGQPLAQDEVEVEVCAIGVNFKDILTVLQRIDSDNVGFECSGTISHVGPNCDLFQVGDRVTLCGANVFKSYARAKVDCVAKIPDGISSTEAAAIPIAFCTAYYGLCDIARLQKNETVLIHAAAGGTGQAAVQIAQIPEDHIFYSRDTTFKDRIQGITNGRGVDVVLNSLSGQSLIASWECIAPCGRFIEIGKSDIATHGSLPMHPFDKNTSFCAVDLSFFVAQQTGTMKRLLKEVMQLIAAKILFPPQPLNVFSITDTEKAFRLLQSGESSGKVVVEVSKKALVPTYIKPSPTYRMRTDATYLIVGGLGGIGRCIAYWLVNRGAKNLILLSRSGSERNPKAKLLLDELKKQNITVVAPKCDVTDLTSLEIVLRDHEKIMPPIKGCFQASMVLRDSLFENLSFQDWQESLGPKIQGSWNLHTALSSDLDFFVLLSSACGIFGNAGQINYAAGNTYQDALARYRISLGLKATALDLGVIASEGIVADNDHLMEYALRIGLLVPLTLDQVFSILDYYCDPSHNALTPTENQPIIGIDFPASIRAKGKDVPHYLRQPLFRNMHQIDHLVHSSSSSTAQTVSYRTLFESAESLEGASLVVSEGLRNKMSKILGIPEGNIELASRMETHGIDSLAGVELRNWLAREMGADVAIFEIMGSETLLGVGRNVAAKSSFQQATWHQV